jgi:hypothetical protein
MKMICAALQAPQPVARTSTRTPRRTSTRTSFSQGRPLYPKGRAHHFASCAHHFAWSRKPFASMRKSFGPEAQVILMRTRRRGRLPLWPVSGAGVGLCMLLACLSLFMRLRRRHTCTTSHVRAGNVRSRRSCTRNRRMSTEVINIAGNFSAIFSERTQRHIGKTRCT